VRIYPLGMEPRDDLSTSVSAEARLAMVWELTARLWSLTGRPLPGYDRRHMPVRVIRRG
jgi:hypothetical protein